jgi:Predicted hydrolase of the alpha/beta superfamily
VKKTRITFRSGELSLEGILTIPEGVEPFPAVIVCHPHSLYGGSMDNNVVNALCEALLQTSLISLKFNFRGVGRSEGEFGQGIGVQEDADAAVSFASTVREADSKRIGLVGYSAGAGFALPVAFRSARIKALAAISPPVSMFNFEFLKDCLKPKLLISGSADDFTPISQFLGFCQSLPQPTEYHSIKGADHFWWGYESALAVKIADFFSKVLK